MATNYSDFATAPLGLYDIDTNEQIPLYFIDINADIIDQFAKVKLTHKYFNPTDHVINTIFMFPKGLYQVFDGLTVEMNEKTLIGLVGKKENVDRNFEAEEEKGNTVVKTETVQRHRYNRMIDLLRTTIGNILPNETISLTFSFIQKLDIFLNKRFSLMLPLTLTPRFVPSSTVLNLIEKYIYEGTLDKKDINSIKECSDIRYLREGSDLYYRYDINVNLHSTFPIQKINSKIHVPTIINRIDDFNASVSLDNSRVNIPNEDFELIYEIDPQYLKTPKLLLTKHPKYEDDYAFWYSFSPEEPIKKELEAIPEIIDDFQGNFIFCIDRSGSMSGKRIYLAKESLLYFIRSLPDSNSNFEIISFGSIYEAMFGKCVPINESNTETALRTIETFTANMGGTNLKQALEYIRGIAKNSRLKTRVFVITDGALFDTNECLDLIAEAVSEVDIKFFSLGIGSGCDENLVRGIGEKGAGVYEFSKNEIDITDKVIYLLESSMKIYLSDFKLTLGRTPNNFYSNFYAKEFANSFQTVNKKIDVFGLLPKEFVNNNTIECSFSITGHEDIKINTKVTLALSAAKTSDILHKMIIGSYYTNDITQCLKYQIIGFDTAFYCLVKENNLTPEEMIKKHTEKIANIAPNTSFGYIIIKNVYGEECQIQFDSSMLVEEAKMEIERLEGTPVDQQFLYFAGKRLYDNRMLGDYNIEDGDVLHLTIRLCGGGEPTTKIIIDKNEFEQVLYSKTYQEVRAEIAKKMKIKEKDYDFIDQNEQYLTHITGEYFYRKEIRLIKKIKVDKIPVEDRLIKNQRINGLWEVNESNLYLINFTIKGWNEFIKGNSQFFKSIVKSVDEKVLLNMYIIKYISTAYKDKIARFKLILQKTEKAIKKILPSYSKEIQAQFNEKIKL